MESWCPHSLTDTMRSVVGASSLVLLLLAGCISDDCLPESAVDSTPPRVRITIQYTAPGSGTETTRVVTQTDTTNLVRASRNERVRVTIAAEDSSGLRRLAPAVTVQQTVGIGVEREFVSIDPVTSSCPRAVLESRYDAHTSGRPRVLIVSAVAENWTGTRATIAPISIRME